MDHRISEVAAKGADTIEAVKSDLKGFEGIFRTLTEEHGEARELLKRVVSTRDPRVRAEFWPQLRFALLGHEHGEVNVLYPVLRKDPATRELAEDHDAQARDLETVIRSLDECAVTDPAWHSFAATLQQLVERHVTEEESKFFPAAQAALGYARARELDESYRQQKPEAETAPARPATSDAERR